MAIGNVIVKGGFAIVYNEKGQQTAAIGIPGAILAGFTSTTVNIKYGGWINMYDEKGHKTGSMPA